MTDWERKDAIYPWEEEREASGKIVGTPKSRGKGKLLSHDMRRLPGELVTDDIGDNDRAHELDERHDLEDLAAKHHWEEFDRPYHDQLAKNARGDSVGAVPGKRKITQELVDLRGLLVLKAWLAAVRKKHAEGTLVAEDMKHKHLWYPEADDDQVYELRPGNPPSDQDRPRHLRGLDLIVDPWRGLNSRQVRMAKQAERKNAAEQERMLREVRERANGIQDADEEELHPGDQGRIILAR